MSKSRKLWIGCGAAVLLAMVIFFSINATRKDEIVIQTSKAEKKEELKASISASGQIRAKKFVDLQSEVDGIITDLPVREGDAVKKGDVLLRIDPIQREASTFSARANYEAAMADVRSQEFQIMNAETSLARDEAILRGSQAQLEQARSTFTKTQNSYKRKQQMHEDGLISREEYEAAQNELKVAESQLKVAEENLHQMELQVQTSKNNIEQMKNSKATSLARAKANAASLRGQEDMLTKTVMRSPLDGVITTLNVEKGERAVPGMAFNPQATLMTISDLSTIQAELKVDETDVINASLGNSAKIKIDALPDEVFDGEVTEIGNSPINASTTSTQQEAKDFKVIVTLKDPSAKLRPGMSCSGDIVTKTKHNVLVVPIQALTIRDVEVDRNGNYHEPDIKKARRETAVQAEASKKKPVRKELEGLFIVNNAKIARFRAVKSGISGDTDIEILENIKEGEEVVSGSFQTLRTLKDGDSVKVDNSVKTASDKKS
jgi:HlyD family secretion protein